MYATAVCAADSYKARRPELEKPLTLDSVGQGLCSEVGNPRVKNLEDSAHLSSTALTSKRNSYNKLLLQEVPGEDGIFASWRNKASSDRLQI